MAKLPNEEEGRAQVLSALGIQLNEMGQLLNLAVTLILPGEIIVTKTRGLDDTVVKVSFCLFVKACKSFRATILLCEAGFMEDAFILARGLFETSLAIFWILQRSSRRRVQMYLAHILMRDRKMMREWKRTKGLKRLVKAATVRMLDEQIAEAQKLLGPNLTKGLDNRYSGMSIENTAKAVGLLPTYQIFYRHASGFGHVSDLSSHVIFTTASTWVQWAGPSDNLKRVMGISYSIFLKLIQTLNDRFGLGHHAAINTVPIAIS